MKVKKRLDALLTEQGYAENRTKAQAIVFCISEQISSFLYKLRCRILYTHPICVELSIQKKNFIQISLEYLLIL